MAVNIRKIFLRALLLDRQVLCPITFCQLRGARYDPKTFLDPTISKEELKKPLKDNDLRKYMKIKAALTDHSTFADYDPIVNQFVNMIMKHGDKKLARSLLAKTFEEIKHNQVEKYHKADGAERATIELEPVKVFLAAIENVKPLLITTKIKRGGVTYQVPIPCRPKVQSFKSMKWLIECSTDKEDYERFYKSLATEILNAYEHKGKAMGKKKELHKMCEANKAYAHYRWV